MQLPFARSRLTTTTLLPYTFRGENAALKALAIKRAYRGIKRIAERRNRDCAARQGFHIAVSSIANQLQLTAMVCEVRLVFTPSE